MNTKRVLHNNEDNGVMGAVGTFMLAVGGQTFAFLANIDSVGALIIALLTFGGPILQVALKHRWATQKEEREFDRMKRQKELLEADNDALGRELVKARRELQVYRRTPPEPFSAE